LNVSFSITEIERLFLFSGKNRCIDKIHWNFRHWNSWKSVLPFNFSFHFVVWVRVQVMF
jgi:hypothetical protein